MLKYSQSSLQSTTNKYMDFFTTKQNSLLFSHHIGAVVNLKVKKESPESLWIPSTIWSDSFPCHSVEQPTWSGHSPAQRLAQTSRLNCPWGVLNIERESTLKNTASKYISIWTPQCLYQTVHLKGSQRSYRKTGSWPNMLTINSFPLAANLSSETPLRGSHRPRQLTAYPLQPICQAKATAWKVDNRQGEATFCSGRPIYLAQ